MFSISPQGEAVNPSSILVGRRFLAATIQFFISNSNPLDDSDEAALLMHSRSLVRKSLFLTKPSRFHS
jgi:hypothetical protein